MVQKLVSTNKSLCGILLTSSLISACANINTPDVPAYEVQPTTEYAEVDRTTQNEKFNSHKERKKGSRISNLEEEFEKNNEILVSSLNSQEVILSEIDENIGKHGKPTIEEFSSFEKYNLSPRFFSMVEEIASKYSMNPSYLLQVIEKESKFDPQASNSVSTAVGLIQFTNGTAQILGTSRNELLDMEIYEQLEFVDKYLNLWTQRGVTPRNFGDMAMLVMWPAAVGRNDDFILYQRGDSAYGGNSPLDLNGDGIVTREEAVRWYSQRNK